MDLKSLGQRAKALVDKRGGTGSVKDDAEELKEIATSKGSLADKAKAAVGAIKEPGEGTPESEAPAAAAASDPEREKAHEKVEGEGRGKHAAGGGARRGRGRRRQGGRRGAGGGGSAV